MTETHSTIERAKKEAATLEHAAQHLFTYGLLEAHALLTEIVSHTRAFIAETQADRAPPASRPRRLP